MKNSDTIYKKKNCTKDVVSREYWIIDPQKKLATGYYLKSWAVYGICKGNQESSIPNS
jgi:Uma2 family endonuclease